MMRFLPAQEWQCFFMITLLAGPLQEWRVKEF